MKIVLRGFILCHFALLGCATYNNPSRWVAGPSATSPVYQGLAECRMYARGAQQSAAADARSQYLTQRTYNAYALDTSGFAAIAAFEEAMRDCMLARGYYLSENQTVASAPAQEQAEYLPRKEPAPQIDADYDRADFDRGASVERPSTTFVEDRRPEPVSVERPSTTFVEDRRPEPVSAAPPRDPPVPSDSLVLTEARRCLEEAEDARRYSIQDVKITHGQIVGNDYVANVAYVVVSDRSAHFESTTGDRYILPLGEVRGGAPNLGVFKLVMEHHPRSWVRSTCERL